MARNSNNLEGPLFSSQFPKMERSSSFREGLESRVAGTPRNMQHLPEIPPLTQYLKLEQLPTREQQQKSTSAELRRMFNVGLDDHGFGSVQSKAAPAIAPEEMKRFKATILETSAKYGGTVKSLQEEIPKVDKCKNMVAKRRQRTSDASGDKSGGSNFSKSSGSHSNNPAHQVLPGEHLGQRQENRPKNLVPNKRARSSLGESRSEGRNQNSMRQAPINAEKEKNMFEKEKSNTSRLSGNEGSAPSEEKSHGLTPGGDGWEKKLKRKRSVGSMVNRANDGAHGDSKQSALTRPNINTESRPRSNDNGLGFRSGLASGIIGGNKTDGSSQQSSGNGTRSSVKTENDSNSAERREQRSTGLDKDRNVPKGTKLVSRDESQAGALNPMAKTKASRAPRTSSFVVMNSSPGYPRLPGSSTDGWDPPVSSNKVQNATPPGPSVSNAPATTNRKRPLPSGPPSPSPPVAQWVGQRPQKSQRTRRANVVSPVSNFDEIQAPNDGSAPSPVSIQNNPGSSSMSQQRNRGDVSISSPANMSESEESKGKGVENGEMVDNKASISTSKKASRVLLKEDLGDGVRRQGRSGRGGGPSQGRSLPPLPKEKTDGSDSGTKPPKSGRSASDRNDSRIGRPPLKKAVDRKSQGRPVQNSQSVPSDMMGELDDDKEELMTAVNAARNAFFDACTGPFWKNMEPVFFSASDNLTFLKNQIAFGEALDRSASEVLVDSFNHEEKAPNHSSSRKSSAGDSTLEGSLGRTKTDELFDGAVPLSQMLLSAFISIDGSELQVDSSTCTPNGISDHFPYDKVDKGQCNGFLDGSLLTSHCQNGPYSQSILQNHEMILNSSHASLYECQYEDMSLDDRILLELHSIGIYPDSMPELDEGQGAIDMSASELQKELAEKVKERKSIMQILEKAFLDDKKTEERHIEQLAMDTLVERACKRLLPRGGSNQKGGVSKLSKQLAQAFGKRTLDKCRKFEESGHSCFSSDPTLCDTLFAPLQRPDSKQPDGVNERRKLDRGPSDLLDQAHVKTDQNSSRGKKREVLLDEVSRGTASAFGPKWKKSDQTKDGSNKNSSPNSNAKGGRGERKNKAKPKQKMGHLSSSQNGGDRVASDSVHLDTGTIPSNKLGQHKTELPGPTNDMNDSLFAGLPIPFDDLDAVVAGDPNDLGSWLNVDDESLQDTDLVGLEIPMDDLADLTFT
ncbi:serine/arginine repetitive matrix protein [Rhynchospora pubera]|uniref:Serine/arginine repetitive matrix protein n=1 Tax=Rhynchospora pubera TaxID=906938 RepID=A0AAV8C7K3_9POAL|nr:serine/arginine repetitive matrix protein [Rhynchospora pubera]